MVQRLWLFVAPYKHYGMDVLVVVLLVLGWHLVTAARHFEWVHLKTEQGQTYAVPAFRK